MILEIRIPSPGESVTEVAIGNWLVKDGDTVEKDQEIAEVETDKATLPLIATDSGKISIRAKAGEKILAGDLACTIDTSVKSENTKARPKTAAAAPVAADKAINQIRENTAAVTPAAEIQTVRSVTDASAVKITPLARRKMEENNLNLDDILKGLKKISTAEVDLVINNAAGIAKKQAPMAPSGRTTERNPMSPLRRKLSKRLVAVKNETAMLTTFNELDMTAVFEMRKKYQQAFQDKHGIKLGMMSFFAKAASHALMDFPGVNSAIEGEDIISYNFVDLSIAVQTDKGLMVPVIRNAESLSLAQIEKQIAELAQKARSNRLTLEEMTGGTFTLTNGGVFGSMLSTPILNPPQSAILGMHNIVDRPVAVQGRIEIRPIMFLALSYDHRIIDGRDSVSFLVKIKELIESPLKMLLGKNPEKDLLAL
jgi:2-oxoglutarate dehydrogenase E2 component (dihydrolipoamide succinyltransferase)